MFSNNLMGTISPLVMAFVNLTTFHVNFNKLTGPLPPMPFSKMASCYLLDKPTTNSFSCPWPIGAVDKCRKWNGGGSNGLVTNSDCTPFNNCTGASTKLDPTECKAWGELYVAMAGDGWNFCIGTKTDPCSCKDTCSSDGTTVVKMCVM